MADNTAMTIDALALAALPSSERVYRSLRDRIVEGKLPPGTRLVEFELAQQFDSSRTPVREALKRLSAEGLVSIDPARGMVVREIDAVQAEEIYVIREVIDGLAGRLAAPRVTEDDLTRLRVLMDTQRECVQDGDWLEMTRANRRYHEVIYRASGSRHLMEMAGNLHDLVRTFSLRCFANPERGQLVVDEHERIAEGLLAHDAPGVEAASKEHIARARAHHARWAASRAAVSPSS
ncbi:MAG TPA: GntR family transcriptional regulator [Chloroflexota bacterium]|jgi:DNA-binding GntR family transcriptional regulator